jgi:hypothetical protein
MRLKLLFRRSCLPAVAVGSAALVGWLSDHGFAGPSLDPWQPTTPALAATVIRATVVLAAIALAGRLYDSRWTAFVGSAFAGVATNAFAVAADWLHAGWGGPVAHDMWFGDHDYWVMVIIRVTVVVMMFAIVVTTTWGLARRPQTHRAG